MGSQVFFIEMRALNGRSLLDRLRSLVEAAGMGKVIKKRSPAAIKIHFGERGNTAFVSPLFIRPIVDAIVEAGGKPFLTDAGTLYVGTRGNAVDHLNTCYLNGFAYSVVGAPIVIADGLDGRDEVAVPVGLKNCQDVYIASAIVEAHSLISVAHFKLHEAAGFGGAIKNVGMGSASRKGKMAQHSEVCPEVISKKCIGCGTCLEQCAHGAITLVTRSPELPRPQVEIDKIVQMDPKKCVGCARCIHVCPQGALGINWEKDLPRFMERMVEYTVGTLKGKEKRSLFVNFLTQITPACDCYPFSDAPIVSDIGILASRDPVAIDRASVDLLNNQPPLDPTRMKKPELAQIDKIKAVYPHIEWRHQLDYAEQVGLGSQSYDLIRLSQ